MKHFTHDLKKEAGRLTLTAREKEAMRHALHSVLHPAPPHSVPSPYWYRLHVSARALALGLLAVVVLGGGTAYAAQGSLPGDPLYGVKINVDERVVGALQFTPSAQAAWQASLAEERVMEAEKLAQQGRLTPVIASQLAANINAHASAAAQLAAAGQSPGMPQSAALVSQTGASLAAHSAILAALGDNASSTESAHAAAVLAADVSSQSSLLLALVTPEQTRHGREGKGRQTGISAGGTASETISTSTTTTATLSTAISATEPNTAALASLRAAALAEIASVESGYQNSALSSSTDAEIMNSIALLRDSVAQADADAAADPNVALSEYRQVFQKAVSLSTLLYAGAQFQVPLLPSTVNTLEDATGTPPSGDGSVESPAAGLHGAASVEY